MSLIADGFFNLQIPKYVVNKLLKSPVSEDPMRSNMANGPKHFSKLNDSTFTIFINPCEYNWRLESLSEWYEKY